MGYWLAIMRYNVSHIKHPTPSVPFDFMRGVARFFYLLIRRFMLSKKIINSSKI